MNINWKFILRRSAALLLALVLTAALFPLPTAYAVEKDEIYAAVEEQVRAFADSIDQKDAVNGAAKALAKHGMTKGGKKLSMGKGHALTAVLFNAELLQTNLIKGCTEAIFSMQAMAFESLQNIRSVSAWYGADDSYFSARVLYGSEADWYLVPYGKYSGAWNSYDSALDWLAANTAAETSIKRVKVTATEAVYEVTCAVIDRFDFDTSNNSGFKKLISGVGALLFREFDWEATVTFELTVPYSCTHSSGTYRWTYDAGEHILTADTAEGYTENNAIPQEMIFSGGVIQYYHKLEEPVRLYHDKPWVMEYDIGRKSAFVFSPFESIISARTKTALLQEQHNFLSFASYEYVKFSEEQIKEYGNLVGQTATDYYGICLSEQFEGLNPKNCTYRLENEIRADGSNMIYLTVRDTDTGEVLVDHVPMDDHYRWESWTGERTFRQDGDEWISGKDFYINYIGNKYKRLSADHFELRIWENGEEVKTKSYCTAKVTRPTCAKGGYTTYTCAACGYSYIADKTPKSDKHTCRGGICTVCGTDTVTAAVEGTTLTLSGTLAAGTRILAACYDGDGRLTGTKMFLWNGEPICDTIPAGESVKIFLTDENWTPLREVILL